MRSLRALLAGLGLAVLAALPLQAQTTDIFNMADEWNDGGTVFSAIKMDVTNTASGAGSLVLDLEVGSTNVFGIDPSGNAIAAAAAYYSWTGRARIHSPADSIIRLSDAAGTDFARLQFGGTTSSYPALKRSSAILQVRLADDSAFGDIAAANVSVASASYLEWGSRGRIYSPADGILRLTDAAGTDFGRLQLGGTTSSFPALKRSSAALHARLGDDSAFADFSAANISGSNISIASASYLEWGSRGRIYSPADAILRLADTAGTDFGRLQFGGTTSSFPSLKRSSAALHARLADDSDYASFSAANISVASASYLEWGSRGRIYSPADAILRLADTAGTDFGRLQFGGTTSSFPALKRNGAGLDLRLADDSAYGVFTALRGVFTAGTATADAPPIDITQTWNNSGILGPLIKGNVTDTSSNASALLMDLQKAGTSMFRVNKNGRILTSDGGFFNGNSTGMFASGTTVTLYANNAGIVNITTTSVSLTTDAYLAFTNGTRLLDDAADVLALRRTTNAQTFRWYFSFTDVSNYARGALKTSSGIVELAAETAGSGADDIDILLSPVGTGKLRMASTIFQLGGTTSSFPSLKRSSTAIQVRLADDSAFAPLAASSITTSATDFLHNTSATLDSLSASEVGTLTNAPTAGNPAKWVKINDNGTTYYLPLWAAP